ncbi:MAG: hypothetical protein AAGH46_04020, partial [Bacteroidota bacterium]
MQIGAIHKSKQFFFHGFKFLAPIIAIVYIGLKLANIEGEHIEDFETLLTHKEFAAVPFLLTLTVFSALNWYLEAIKWQI